MESGSPPDPPGSRSAAETQQRAVWQGIAKVFVDEIV